MRRWWGLAIGVYVLGCTPVPRVGGPCSGTAPCTTPLVCVFDACRDACGSSGECPDGTVCVADTDGRRACTLPAEEACGRGGGCPGGLLCVEDHCRARCAAGVPRCAPGSECVTSGSLEICRPSPPVDGGPADAGTMSDAPSIDAGPPDAPRIPALPFCETNGCTSASDCMLGACETETVRHVVATGLPGDAGFVDLPNFVGGTCVTQTRAPINSPGQCQWFVNAPTSECGACARCLLELDPSGGYLSTVCRDRCDPAVADSCRTGYACDPITRTCQDACVDDDACRVYRVDSDGDGQLDRWEYDPSSQAFCNARGLCEEGGTTPVLAGEACARHSECGPRGLCLSQALLEDTNRSGECVELQCNGFLGGYCTRTNCRDPGNACSDGEICARGLDLYGGTTELCLRACEMGAEPVADRLGRGGHGQTCRPGYRCRRPSDGPTLVAGAPATGGCIFGNYNDVTTPNVGEACASAAECWSPFGSAICGALGFASNTLTNACILDGCHTPGLPPDFCGPNATCSDFGTASFCFRNCASASECAPGWGCLDITGGLGSRVCLSNCIAPGDCRDGEGCYRSDAISVGACVPGGTCASPVSIAEHASVQGDGSLRLIGTMGSEVHYGCGGPLPGTALRYVPPADGVLVADAGGPMADGPLLLRARSDCGGISADLACGLTGPSPTQVVVRVEAGRPYFLVVDSGAPTTTTFDLTLRFVPLLRPGEVCDASADACPSGYACLPAAAGDTICQLPDLGCGAGVPMAPEATLSVGSTFNPPIDGALPAASVPPLTGGCATAPPGVREVVHPFVSPVDGVLTVVAAAAFDVTLSARTECRTASTEQYCSAFDLDVAPPLPASAFAGPDPYAWLAYLPARVNVAVTAGVPIYVVVEGAAPSGGYRLFARVLPIRDVGQACDPLRASDSCRRGSHCDTTTSVCVTRDEGCGAGIGVADLSSLVPSGDDVTFTYTGATPALGGVYSCDAVPRISESWHRVRLPGAATDLWDFEIRAAMGSGAFIHTAAHCGDTLGSPMFCGRGDTLASTRPIAGGGDLFFGLLPGSNAGPTYGVEVHVWRASTGACGGAGDFPCPHFTACHAGSCVPTLCGDGIAEGSERCDSTPLCTAACDFINPGGIGSASCAGVVPLPLDATSTGLGAFSGTSTLGDAPSVTTSCGGDAPARHYLLDVPVRAALVASAGSYAGGAVVSVRTDCLDGSSELACVGNDVFANPVRVGVLDPGRYVVSIQFPSAGPGGTQGFLIVDLVPE